MRVLPQLFLIAALSMLLAACDVSRQANAVATAFWQGMADRDLDRVAALSTPSSRWMVAADIDPMLGQRVEFDPSTDAGRDDLQLRSRIERPHIPGQPIEFDTVLRRTADGFQVDLLATAESFQAGTRAAAAARYARAADDVAALLGGTSEALVAELETLRRRIVEQMNPEAIERGTRALRDEIAGTMESVRAGITRTFSDVADELERFSRDLREYEAPDARPQSGRDEDSAAH